MPMFGSSRKRATSNPQALSQPSAPPNASASLAATRAFTRDSNVNAELSSAAAAAALRTLSPAPTPVGDTVTKRMVRKGSLSSQGSNSLRPQNLRRHSSSGSMTERSFRDKSPSRSSPTDRDAPPVPLMPKNLPTSSAVHRRASSLEPSGRGGSPVGRGGGGRGVSLDRGIQTTGRGQPRMTSTLSQVAEMETTGPNGGPRSSINFSRPMSPQQTPSPNAGRGEGRKSGGWFAGPIVNEELGFRDERPRPKTSQGISSFESHNAQQVVQNAADRAVSTTRSQMGRGVEGARLSIGSMRAKPRGTAAQSRPHTSGGPRMVDPKSPLAVYDPSTRTFIYKGDAIALHKALSEEELNLGPSYETQGRGTTGDQYEPPQTKIVGPSATASQHMDERVSDSPRQQEYQPHQHSGDGMSVTSSQTYSENRSYDPQTSDLTKQQPILERQHSEDLAHQDVRPAKDANSSHKLEINVPNRDKTPSDNNVQSPKLASNLESPYPRLEPSTKSQSNPPPSLQHRLSARSERNQSLSPPRNAHFAPVATELHGVKHQPLPRSISPAKSALKTSPSPSRRSYSPGPIDVQAVHHGAPPSETSDAMSDGEFRKKKKNVRVSFEEAPVIAGTSAYSETDSPSISTRSGASRWSTINDDEDLGDYSKPRPVLPSFGSIRDRNRRPHSDEGPEKVTETVSSSLSASAVSTSAPLETSSDHLVGGLLAHEFAANAARNNNDPLPPEVTSVEGTGYGSDSDVTDSSFNEPAPLAGSEPDTTALDQEPSVLEPEPKTLTNPVESKPAASEVPNIAVQPASPLPMETKEFLAHEEKKESPIPNLEREVHRQRSFVPGGWDEDEESDKDVEESRAVQPTPTTEPTPTGPSIRFELPPSPSHDVDTDSSDNDSIYSDAYEELTDFERGFGSIDAVVESPIRERFEVGASQYSPVSSGNCPSGLRMEDVEPHALPDEEEKNTANWDATRGYWSRINESRKAQSPARNPSSAIEEKQTTAVSTPERPIRQQPVEEVPNFKQKPPTSDTSAPPRKSALKKPVHPPQATSVPETQMRKATRDGSMPTNASTSEQRFRKSMRDGPVEGSSPSADTKMRRSMRGPDPKNASSARAMPATSGYSTALMDTKLPKGTLQKRHIPSAAAAASSAPRERPQSASASVPAVRSVPAATYDSDSDASASSFQRQRPRRNHQDGGRYTMRASMRSGPAPASKPAPAIRSISPPSTSSQPPPAMKRSMRQTLPTAESPASGRVKSSRFSIRSLSPAGRFRSKEKTSPSPIHTSSPKTKGFTKSMTKAPAPKAPTSRFKSRFADSSDEEDDTPRRFQSRFADSDDSDDYELPPGLTPVRGIPRKAGDEDGDSTDLEDEESEMEAPTQAEKPIAVHAANGVTNGQGSSLAAGSLRDSSHSPGMPTMEAGKKAKPKRGFFGLGKKKQPPPSYIEDGATNNAENSTASDIPMPPGHRNLDRDRDLNRPLSAIGEDAEVEGRGQQPQQSSQRSPKLQRRTGTPRVGRSTSDSWPLPTSPPPLVARDDAQRPNTSDGAGIGRSRPTLVKRGSELTTGGVSVGRSGKKKKFQGLRRVFGLND